MRFACSVSICVACAVAVAHASSADGVEIEHFERHVRPIFEKHCIGCHGAKKQEAGLRLDRPHALIQPRGTEPPLVTPKNLQGSLLFAALMHDGDVKMPPEKKLPDRDLAVVRRWIERGAALPAERPAVAGTKEPPWSFRPRANPKPPAVRNSDWVRTPIDRFVLARLEAAGLRPATEAERPTWLRRVTFDLTGLPPTFEEVRAFVADDSPRAEAAVVDRLLASPAYGERWGRRWLDVVRYADSNGLDENLCFGHAWRFRDYVVAGFNADLPFDRFVVEQIAGDLLPAANAAERERLHIATGFLSLGPKLLAEADKEKLQLDIVDEQVDTLGRAFLGMTLGCARCHDHKFDPISTADYYGLAGIFHSTHTMDNLKTLARWHEHPTPKPGDDARKKAYEKKVTATKAEVAKMLDAGRARVPKRTKPDPKSKTAKPAPPSDAEAEAALDETEKLSLNDRRAALAILTQVPPEPTGAMGVKEAKVADLAVRVRGDPHKSGKTVPRRTPSTFDALLSAPKFDAKSSGRLALARWIVDPKNPLTARVIVNRVWRWHFGKGLSASVDNFGRLGSPPVDPELLDWLANDFIAGGWSLKRLHRTILLSSAYAMSHDADPRAASVDPEGKLLTRFARRRLEAEEIRDAALGVAGKLDRRMGGSLLEVENRAFFFDHTSIDRTKYSQPRRTLYLPLVRNHLADVLQLFDAPDAATVNGDRGSTAVPTQALFLMNSETMLDAAAALAARAWREGNDDGKRLAALYRFALSREPRADEIAAARTWLAKVHAALPSNMPTSERDRQAWTALAQTLLASNEFLYVE